MIQVQTAKGPVDSGSLGRVLVHEHVICMDMEYTLNYRPDFVREEQIAEAANRLNKVKALGIDTIIDLTVLGLGRNIPLIAEVAERTNINIIVATGCYTFDELPKGFAHWGPGQIFNEPDPMPDMFVRDITVGVHGTRVKAGALKCAIDAPGLKPGVERAMRAVGQANVRTGAPISVHTSARHGTGLIAQQVLTEEGVDLRDVIIGHCGDSTDLDYLMKVADQGSILGMDRFGMNAALPLKDRVATIAALIKRGYLDRIAISHDCFCWSDFFPTWDHKEKYLPGHNYETIPTLVIPAMLEAGITRDEIDTMQIANPRRHFEDAAKRFAKR